LAEVENKAVELVLLVVGVEDNEKENCSDSTGLFGIAADCSRRGAEGPIKRQGDEKAEMDRTKAKLRRGYLTRNIDNHKQLNPFVATVRVATADLFF